MSGGTVICYIITVQQQRGVLQHGEMSVSAAPAGRKSRFAKKVSQDPEGDGPDKGAERCW